MGRKAIPIPLKVLRGNPGKQKLPENEPQPPMNMPKPPQHLCKDAKREWKKICPALHAMGVLSEIDKSILAAYCASYALWEKSWRAIKQMESTGKLGAGLMIQTTNGNMIQNPLVGTANKAAGDMIRYASELGMTPAARTRIKAGPQAEKSGGRNYFD